MEIYARIFIIIILSTTETLSHLRKYVSYFKDTRLLYCSKNAEYNKNFIL